MKTGMVRKSDKKLKPTVQEARGLRELSSVKSNLKFYIRTFFIHTSMCITNRDFPNADVAENAGKELA